MSSYQPAVSREDCEKRLRKTFPREVFDPATANRLGASAVAAMIYVGAVVPDEGTTGEDATWCRPTSILWMSDDVLLPAMIQNLELRGLALHSEGKTRYRNCWLSGV